MKELTKISGGKVWSDHPYMVGNLGVKDTKSIMHQTWHAVSEWLPDVKTERTYQNFRGQSMVRSLQTDSIIVSHLMKIVVLITILFIILAVSLKFWVQLKYNI